MENRPTFWQRFFSVYLKKDTYKNFLYLFLAFPFGVLYFIFMVGGITTGISLFIVWVGIPILAGTLAMSWLFSVLERILANELLDARIAPSRVILPAGASFWQKLKTYTSNSFLWRGLAFLFLKFPVGIGIFIVWVTLLSVSLGFLAAPFFLLSPHIHIENFWLQVASLPATLICLVLGVFSLTGSLHIFNLFSRPLRRLAIIFLRPPSQQSA